MNEDTNYLDDELEEEDVVGVDEAVLRLITEEESELNMSSGFDDDILSASIRRLYLAGKISKRKEGKKIYYRLAEHKEDSEEDDSEEGLEGESASDRKNISRMARKFRSCRYKVVRGYIAPNGLGYSMSIEKKGITYYLSYITDADTMEPDIFSKMLENDTGIRIVVPDNRTKLAVAKNFDVFVRNSFGEDEGLLCFNQEHSFRVLTIDQFFQKTTWKNLVK